VSQAKRKRPNPNQPGADEKPVVAKEQPATATKAELTPEQQERIRAAIDESMQHKIVLVCVNCRKNDLWIAPLALLDARALYKQSGWVESLVRNSADPEGGTAHAPLCYECFPKVYTGEVYDRMVAELNK